MALFTQKAVKEKLKARVAIDGPTGSGKTWTALQWATIIADGAPIGVIDTENRSAAYYAAAPGQEVNRLNPWDPPYDFFHFPVAPPYDPRRLADFVMAAADDLGEDGVLIIDSLSHYWEGDGGTLDIVEDAAGRSGGGNKFAGWKEGTPAQRHMLDTIVHAPFHVICTMRSKMEYTLVEYSYTGKDGKQRTGSRPEKVGMAPVQRAGVEYEFTVVADMELPSHRLYVSKSRCDVIADAVADPGRSHEVAQAFAEWLATGVKRLSQEQASAILDRYRQVADESARRELWEAFTTKWGKLSELEASRLPEVELWVEAQLAPPEPTDQAAPTEDDAPAAPQPDDGVQHVGGPLADAIAAAASAQGGGDE